MIGLEVYQSPLFSGRSTSRISWSRLCTSHGLAKFSWKPFPSRSVEPISSSLIPFFGSNNVLKRDRIHPLSPNISSPSFAIELLDAWDDEYDGIIINAESLPSSANAFACALKASLPNWKLKGKRGIWLKVLVEQADLVPIAIQEGFVYHHAEPGYVMLTYWIPEDPCLLPASPSHQIGIAAFVINDKKEILAVKEKCPCSCSSVWKLPTGYIDKSEEIYSGAVREVKEETGVETAFLELVAFRHAQLVAFEKSDLMFVCMLKPMSFEITVDQEIQDAKWITLDELIGQAFYEEDEMSKRVIEICMAAHKNHKHNGFITHRLTSKFDGKPSYLYYKDLKNT